jgi:hypothetical protein
LFELADRDGLWFYCNYQDLWFSPNELREQHNKGSFLWGAVNWQLRNPDDKLLELLQSKKGAESEIARFKERLSDRM